MNITAALPVGTAEITVTERCRKKGSVCTTKNGLVEGPDMETQLSQTLKDDSTVVRSKQC